MKRITSIALALVYLLLSSQAFAVPMTQQAPAWVYQDAKYDFDFAGNRYWGLNLAIQSGNSSSKRMQSMGVEQSGGGTKNTYYRPDPSGKWLGNQDQYAPPVTGYGLWEEGQTQATLVLSSNYALWSRDWTNAVWTAVTATVAKNQTGADGVANAASSITATSAAATVLQTVSQPVLSATVASGGVATYAVGNHLTVVGGTCTTAPVLNVSTVNAGLPTAYTIFSAGSCSVTPTNPVSTTGGGGTGATANLTWPTFTPSMLMKRITGTGAVSVTMDGSTYTAVTGSINSSGYLQVSAPSQAVSSIIFGVKLATNGDAVAVDFGQVEPGPTATSPILTTSTSVARGPEALYVNNSTVANGATADNAGYLIVYNLLSGSPITGIFQYSGNFDPTASHLIFGDSLGNNFYLQSTGGGSNTIKLVTGSGTFTSSNTDTSGLLTFNNPSGTLNKVGAECDGSGCTICVNGILTDSTSVKMSPFSGNITHAGFLSNGSNLLSTNGYEKRATFWSKKIDRGLFQQLCTVTNNQ